MKEKKEFGTPQNELFQQLYEEAKTHTFTEKEIREGFAYIIGVGNEEFKLDIAFFPSGRVSVYENREEDEAVATYTTYENWLIYFESYRTPSNSEIDYNKAYKEDEPSGPYKPRALIDNSMYFINRDGKIIIYDEETATEYAKKLVDIERKAYEENRDHDSDPELKKMWDKYDGTGHIVIYKDYDAFMHHHRINDIAPHRLKWISPDEDEDIFEFGYSLSPKPKKEELLLPAKEQQKRAARRKWEEFLKWKERQPDKDSPEIIEIEKKEWGIYQKYIKREE